MRITFTILLRNTFNFLIGNTFSHGKHVHFSNVYPIFSNTNFIFSKENFDDKFSSSAHSGEFDNLAALKELYIYVNKYYFNMMKIMLMMVMMMMIVMLVMIMKMIMLMIMAALKI